MTRIGWRNATALVLLGGCLVVGFTMKLMYSPAEEAVLFDDFFYMTARKDHANSIFSNNLWNVSDGVRGKTREERAWYWYNWYEPGYDGAAISRYITFPEPGRMRITMPAGTGPADFAPAVMSGFTFRDGTVAARVRFGRLEPGIHLQQAFWTVSPLTWSEDPESPQHRTEMDIEWNNWFAGTGWERVHAGNHGYSTGVQEARGEEMACFAQHSGRSPARIACATLMERWLTLVIAYDGRKTRYALVGAPEDHAGAVVWGGRAWREPVTIQEPLPVWPSDQMAIMFSQHLRSDTVTARPHVVEVDWLYYTSAVPLSVAEVHEQVTNLQQRGIIRLNTTGQPTQVDHTSIQPYEVHIEGPDTTGGMVPGTWRAEVSLRATHYFYQWQMRDLLLGGTVGPWSQVLGQAPVFSTTLADTACKHPGADLRVTVTDQWTSFETHHIISLHNAHCGR